MRAHNACARVFHLSSSRESDNTHRDKQALNLKQNTHPKEAIESNVEACAYEAHENNDNNTMNIIIIIILARLKPILLLVYHQ